MPKNEKIIRDIIIRIDDDITVEQLSEGEKKLILVKTVLEILSDEKTLDEYLREGKFENLVSIYDFGHNIDRFLNAVVNNYGA